MTQWRQFVSFNIEVARKNMYIFKAVILQLFITWQEKSYSYGMLKKNPFWDAFPIGWDACDDQANLEIFRAPFDIFNEFLTVPLKNSSGQWVCKNSERKKILKEAYCALGMKILFLQFPRTYRKFIFDLMFRNL